MDIAVVPAAGDVVSDRYRLEREIGRGGMGVVWRATHLTLREPVALKLVRSDAGAERVRRFLREARVAARLTSENAARVRDAGVLPSGAPFMVLELLAGRDLSQVLKQDGPAPEATAAWWVLEACDALAEAHALGIVHRDLKPSNLFLVDRRGMAPSVKVLDFGVSKVADTVDDASLTHTGGIIGSPRYMSPEQVRDARSVDHRSDVWSLGVVLHELVTGRTPFDAETTSGVLAQVVADLPASLRERAPNATDAFVATVHRCLEKQVEARFPHVAALARALAPLVADRSAAAILLERIERRGAPRDELDSSAERAGEELTLDPRSPGEAQGTSGALSRAEPRRDTRRMIGLGASLAFAAVIAAAGVARLASNAPAPPAPAVTSPRAEATTSASVGGAPEPQGAALTATAPVLLPGPGTPAARPQPLPPTARRPTTAVAPLPPVSNAPPGPPLAPAAATERAPDATMETRR